MKITKFGHACILVEEGNAHILIDPGSYSGDVTVQQLDAILVTHNHQDHLDIGLIQKLLAAHPNAQVITVAEAGKGLEAAGIQYTCVGAGDELEVAGVPITVVGTDHAHIYGDLPQCENSGFLIARKLYHPGDAFGVPEESVEILALPVAGPWMKLGECIDYAQEVHPRIVFPIHDGFIRPDRGQSTRRFPQMVLEPLGIGFRDMQDGSVEEF